MPSRLWVRMAIVVTAMAVVVGGGVLVRRGLPPRKSLWTALHEGDIDQVQQHVRWFGRVNARDGGFRTPLYWAARMPSARLTQWLLAHGADVSVLDGNNESPLHWACRDGRSDTVCALLLAGADPNGTHRLPFAGPLELVVRRWTHCKVLWEKSVSEDELLAMMRLLLLAGADPNVQVDGGSPLFHDVVGEDLAGPTRLMLIAGADPRKADSSGSTALHTAALSASPEIVSMLLGYGADVDAVDSSGMTPVDVAREAGRIMVVNILLSRHDSFTDMAPTKQ